MNKYALGKQKTLAELCAKKDEQIASQKALMERIKRDLLLRSDTDSNGLDVVNLINSLWLGLKEATKDI